MCHFRGDCCWGMLRQNFPRKRYPQQIFDYHGYSRSLVHYLGQARLELAASRLLLAALPTELLSHIERTRRVVNCPSRSGSILWSAHEGWWREARVELAFCEAEKM